MPENKDDFIVLLNDYLKGDLDPLEMKQLESDLRADPKKQLLFDLMTSKRESGATRDQTEAAYAKQREKLVHMGAMDAKHKKTIRLPKYWQAAAASILVILSIAVLYQYNRLGSSTLSGSAEHRIATAKGERKQIVMPDGSQIWLNGESELIYGADFNIDNRNISLRGEAYFEVAKNKNKPFILSSNDVTIKVLGTEFNVRSYGDEGEIQTSLIEGKIELSTASSTGSSQSFTMEPGEKITIQKRLTKEEASDKQPNTAEIKDDNTVFIRSKIKQDIAQSTPSEILWKDNTLVLDSDPIHIVASKLEKWYNKTILIEETANRQLKYNGTFGESDIQNVLQILKESGGNFDYKINQDTIRIY